MEQDSTSKTQHDWDLFFLKLCKQYSQGSKDPSSKVAACIVKDNELLTISYNGFAKGADDSPELYLDKGYKYPNIIHAESNAIQRHYERFKDGGPLTLYVYPYSPCCSCGEVITDYGIITRVVTTDYIPDRWKHDTNVAKVELTKAGIQIDQIPITHI